MKKLKIILLFSLLIILLIRIIYVNNYKTKYKLNDCEITGSIESINVKDNKTKIVLKGMDKVLVIYDKTIKFKYGDIVKVIGTFTIPNNEYVFNLFSYKKYLLSKKIFNIMNAEKILLIKENNNLLYKIKNFINDRINSIENTYLNTFILAFNNIDDKIYQTYVNNGISHLFAISGMHIGLFSFLLLFILNKMFYNKRISYIITDIILLIYMLLIMTPSIIRSVLSFILLSINKIFRLNITSIEIIILIIILLLIHNPYYIYNISFLYTFVNSFALIKFNKLYKNKNYISKLLIISIITFLASFPITINNNFNINALSIISNLIFVPIISFILFPMSLVVFIFPSFNNIYLIIIKAVEELSAFINKYSLNINFSYMNIYIIIAYYFIIYILLTNPKLYKMIILIIYFIIHYNIHSFNNNYSITMFDVNQGDSMLLEMKNKSNILIDTGGSLYTNYFNNRIKPYLYSLGIRKIDYLILTHGDFDHMGEAISIIENFKVNNVIFNIDSYNNLEQQLIDVLKEQKIKYYKGLKEINIEKNKIYFLNTGILNNENDNSNVIYFKYYKYKFLFMGDAGIEKEKKLLNKYELENIDFFKIGHHGSNTSTSKEFVKSIKPKNCLISVGKNNRYGHPAKTVLDNLSTCNVYRTDINGSIKIEISKNKYIIKTIH